MRRIVTVAVIIHNMVVESGRSVYTSDGTGGRSAKVIELNIENDLTFVPIPPASILVGNSAVRMSDDIKIKGMHRDLKSVLIEHLWVLFGLK